MEKLSREQRIDQLMWPTGIYTQVPMVSRESAEALIDEQDAKEAERLLCADADQRTEKDAGKP